MEYKVTEYLLQHKSGIQDHLKDTIIKGSDNPIFKSYFEDAVTTEVIQFIANGTGLNYEEVGLVITKDYLIELFGEEFFKL